MEPVLEDFADLYDNAPCGHLTISPAGRIVSSNATLSAWIGSSSADLNGTRLIDLFTLPSKIFYETHAGPLLRMQGRFQEIALDLAIEGGRIAVLANAVEKRDADGGVVFTRMALFQATERRRHEREIRDLNIQLEAMAEEAMRSRLQIEKGLLAERELGKLREQFIAVLGHDLRNPLAAISSGAELLRREGQSEKGERVLGMMQGSVSRMAALIEDVMDLARSRLGGGIVLDRNALEPIEPVIRQVVAELRAGSPGRIINANISLAEPIDCDRARLGQMVSNLLGNALTHGAKDQPIRVDAKMVDGGFELSVSNRGAPIPPEAMARLFQPFFRGDVRNSQQGLGLGLHIASEIAEAHGGTLAATSTEEETSFTFRMPLAATS